MVKPECLTSHDELKRLRFAGHIKSMPPNVKVVGSARYMNPVYVFVRTNAVLTIRHDLTAIRRGGSR